VGDGDGGAWVWTRGGGEAGGERSGAAAPFIVIGRAPGRIGCGAGGIGARGGGARARGAGYAGAAAATAMPARVWGFMRAEWPMREGERGGARARARARWRGGGGGAAAPIRQRRGKKPKRFYFPFSSLFVISVLCVVMELDDAFSGRAPYSGVHLQCKLRFSEGICCSAAHLQCKLR
jgi:hypothetical protein